MNWETYRCCWCQKEFYCSEPEHRLNSGRCAHCQSNWLKMREQKRQKTIKERGKKRASRTARFYLKRQDDYEFFSRTNGICTSVRDAKKYQTYGAALSALLHFRDQHGWDIWEIPLATSEPALFWEFESIKHIKREIKRELLHHQDSIDQQIEQLTLF